MRLDIRLVCSQFLVLRGAGFTGATHPTLRFSKHSRHYLPVLDLSCRLPISSDLRPQLREHGEASIRDRLSRCELSTICGVSILL